MKKLSLIAFILFATTAATFAQTTAAAKAELQRLHDLNKRLAAIPMNRLDRPPHKAFIKRNQKDIVYSEPSGQYYVRSDRFWALHKKYQKLAFGEEIAWAASQNILPGECEGEINCYTYTMTETDGRYLSLYPKGKYSPKAINTLLTYLGDVTDGENRYEVANDDAGRADLQKTINKLRQQLSGVRPAERDKLYARLDKLEAFAKK